MADIFDELGSAAAAEQEQRAGAELADIFAPEFLAAHDADVLRAAFSGLSKAMKAFSHPDSIVSRTSPELVDRARDAANADDLEVAAFNEKLRDGAGIVDTFTRLEETVKADPTAARMGALAAVRKQRGFIPTGRPSRRQSQSEDVSPKPEGVTAQTPVIETNVHRSRLETVLDAESLRNIGDAYVLSAGENPALFYIGNQYNDLSFSEVTMQPLQVVLPQGGVTETWSEEAAKRVMAMVNDGHFTAEDFDPVKQQGLLLTVGDFIDQPTSVGRQIVLDTFDRLNRKGTHSADHPYDPEFYQLAVLNEQGLYEFVPTAKGLAHGFGPTVLEDQVFHDWVLTAYGQLPSVLSMVNLSPKGSEDVRILRAYDKTQPAETVISPSKYGLGKTGIDLDLLGFTYNVSQYLRGGEETATAELTTGADTQPVKSALVELREDADVLFMAGLSDDFSPVRGLQRAINSQDFALVFRMTEKSQLQPEERQVSGELATGVVHNFAIRTPQALGAREPSMNTSALFNRISTLGRREADLQKIRDEINQLVDEI